MNDTDILHPIEKAILGELRSGRPLNFDVLASTANLNIDQLRRGIERLKFKGYIHVRESSKIIISLGPNGLDSIVKGLPERRLINALKDGYKDLNSIKKAGLLDGRDLEAAVNKAKIQNRWIEQSTREAGDRIFILNESAEQSSQEEMLIERIGNHQGIQVSDLSAEEVNALNLLRKRPNFVNEINHKDIQLEVTPSGLQMLDRADLSAKLPSKLTDIPIDVISPVSSVYPGRTHPLTDLIEEIKEIFVSLGFTEIEGETIQPAFWNFDALFIPQDHPAREMQDTFYLKDMKRIDMARSRQIQEVSQTHSKWWNYDWDLAMSERLVLRTHTTPVTLRFLADNGIENARIFSVGKVFRNEKMSYKHLVEFSQVEGVVTGSNVSLTDLMGLQTEFYKKLGIKRVKFWPTYFPYTEPSLQSMIFNDNLDKWVELFGMGIFRPQVTEPLGIKNPVLAWGGGIERIAMLRLGLSDVREIYNNKLNWLRKIAKCRL
ncbi:MAG: phenylalanine--tRNA ligase subunit alpha [Nitrososphaeraceae archaeon]